MTRSCDVIGPYGGGPGGVGDARPRAHGKFLYLESHRFLIRGVTYGTFAPDAQGGQFPPPDKCLADFSAISKAGFNTVRTYTPPSPAMLDVAAGCGLRVMVGLPWTQHVAFLESAALMREVRASVREQVRALAQHPAALLFAIGNEIPPAVVRWHGAERVSRFLRDLYLDVKGIAPDVLASYVNFPPTEHLDLSFVDIHACNVYLHRQADLRAYIARLQHIAGDKPLLLAEMGADSLRHGQDGQAALTSMQIDAAFREGACGAVAFAWTDEWWRGGDTVDDWAFGLVDAERRPKAALQAVAKTMADAPFPAAEQAHWPHVSVVVCAYNAASTIDECLASLGHLTYPHYEVIVVDDGSRDATARITSQHPHVRLISTPNGGLSRARNIGIAEASGEIVAFTDADVRVDPDWLTYLVQPMLTSDVVGAGGPNVVPGDDPWLAQCVARAPGGPTHVMLDDRVAEHVPGCNMAFRREALLAINGFDAIYQRAGDDVDLCWRLQRRGWQIGFAPAALVWHRHRGTVRAYWRQQVGYGEGETWLTVHHPEKFVRGRAAWRGRIYSPLPFVRSLRRPRVNTGTWGTAAFPAVYTQAIGGIDFLPHSVTWLLLSLAMLAASVVAAFAGLASTWLASMLTAGLLGLTITAARCLRYARAADLQGLPRIGTWSSTVSRWLYRLTIAYLHIVQPAARATGRLKGLLSPPVTEHGVPARPVGAPTWRELRTACRVLLRGRDRQTFWTERWTSAEVLLTRLVASLRRAHVSEAIDVDDGWHQEWDVSLGVAGWARLDVRMLVEEHAKGACLVRVSQRLRPTLFGHASARAVMALALCAAAIALRGAWHDTMIMIPIALAILGFSLWRMMRTVAIAQLALFAVMAEYGMYVLDPRAGTVGRATAAVLARADAPAESPGHDLAVEPADR